MFNNQTVSTYLNRGGSIGSFCISTIRMTLCLAPELNATPCCEGVYLLKIKNEADFNKENLLYRITLLTDCKLYRMYCAGACLSAARTGMAAAIFCDTCLSRAALVFSVSLGRRRKKKMMKNQERLVNPFRNKDLLFHCLIMIYTILLHTHIHSGVLFYPTYSDKNKNRELKNGVLCSPMDAHLSRSEQMRVKCGAQELD